ncbi:MAG: TonB-dependent siderophore receptor [Bacteroidetes bacterium]|jgi:iron complex outermembrane receptor protein|nr:TonB-dependent siderophore receptor [Bacteroidota bacterium]
MQYRFIFPLLISLLLSINADPLFSQDQPAITGTVVDAETNIPIQGVNVGIKNSRKGTSTDFDGTFSLKNVEPGEYTLVFSAIGYQTNQKIVTLEPNRSLTVEIALSPGELKLQEVEIVGRPDESYKVNYSFTATKIATLTKNIPQSISIISKELLRDQQTYNLGEVVKNISGVNQFSHYNDFTMRGFRGGARLINGLRAEQNFFSMPITPHLERVEVIKGPASALFADANPGGTINMVTKKPLENRQGSAGVTAGSYDTYRANADITGPVDSGRKLLYRLNAGFENSNSFRDFQGNDSYILAPSLSILPTESTRLNVDFVYHRNESKLDRGQPIFNSEDGLDSTPVSFTLSQPSDFYNVDNLQLNATLSQQINENLSLNASFMRYEVDTDLEEHRTTNNFIDETTIQMGFVNRERFINTNSLSTYLTAEGTTGAFEHNALFGFDYADSESDRAQWFAGWDRSDSTKVHPRNFDLENPVYSDENPVDQYPRNFATDFDTPTRYNTTGFYFQDQISAGRWKALVSIRREFYEDVVPDGDGTFTSDQDAWLPRFGLVYETGFRTNVYASYATGFEPVSAGNNAPEFGGPFDPERSELFEVGAKGTYFANQLIATLSLYQIEKRNVLISANSPENPDLLEQRGAQESRGVELEVNGRVNENLSISANYAHNLNEITESDDPEEIGNVAENAPRNIGGLWTKYQFTNPALNGLGIAGGFNFVSERNTFDERLQLPGYTVFDAAVSYEYSDFRVAVNFNNIFDKKHWIGGYNFGRIFPGSPRTAIAKITYNF